MSARPFRGSIVRAVGRVILRPGVSGRAYAPGVQAVYRGGRPSNVAPNKASGPILRHDIALVRGPLGLVWYGRSHFVPISAKHEAGSGGMEPSAKN
jgi:hypothetical protein